MKLELELLPEPGRSALRSFCEGDRRDTTIRALRRHKLVAWVNGSWRLTRGGIHAAKHYRLAISFVVG